MKARRVSNAFPQREAASKALRDLARELRKRQTSAERVLWEALRDRRADGLKFRRQYPVPGTMYVADFCSVQARLLVELDGEIHMKQGVQDRERQQELEDLGYRVLRFGNDQVLKDLTGVLAEIARVAGDSQ